MLGSAAVTPRTCTVRFSGPSGIRHSVDVTAESVYETAALQCRLSGRAAGPTPWRWEPNLRFKSENRPRVRLLAGIDDGAEALECSGAAPGSRTGTRRVSTRVCAVVGVMRGWQMIARWTHRLSAADAWLYTHCETVIQYAIMR